MSYCKTCKDTGVVNGDPCPNCPAGELAQAIRDQEGQ